MRIVAGTARGRTLAAIPKGVDIRPTSDRVREAIFNILGQWMDGARVLDLYAGSGALGLEAVSRGAHKATLVDVSREAVGLCRKNASALGFAAKVEILEMLARAAVGHLRSRKEIFDLVFLDPPYREKAAWETPAELADAGLLAPDARVVLEQAATDAAFDRVGSLIATDRRRFGRTAVTIFSFEHRAAIDEQRTR